MWFPFSSSGKTQRAKLVSDYRLSRATRNNGRDFSLSRRNEFSYTNYSPLDWRAAPPNSDRSPIVYFVCLLFSFFSTGMRRVSGTVLIKGSNLIMPGMLRDPPARHVLFAPCSSLCFSTIMEGILDSLFVNGIPLTRLLQASRDIRTRVSNT